MSYYHNSSTKADYLAEDDKLIKDDNSSAMDQQISAMIKQSPPFNNRPPFLSQSSLSFIPSLSSGSGV